MQAAKHTALVGKGMIVLDEQGINASLGEMVLPPNLREEATLVREPAGSDLDDAIDFEPSDFKHAHQRGA